MSFYINLPAVALPGPRPLPLLGARGNLLRFLGDPVATMLRLHERYGDIVPLTRDDPGWILAFGAEHNRTILTDKVGFHNFADHPLKLPPTSAAAKFSLSLVNQNGETHSRSRRMMMPAFSKAKLADYARLITDTGARALQPLRAGQVVDAHTLSINLSLNVTLRCLFNVDIAQGTDSLGATVLDYLNRVFSPANMLLPFDLPGTPYARFMTSSERLGDRVEQLIRERREQLHTHDPGEDILSTLIQAYAHDSEHRSTRAVDDELLGQTAMLLVAGHDTTAHTLAWTLFLLTQHPELQAALGREIDEAGLADQPNIDAVMALPLLDRVVKESMRLLPAVPFLFFRRSTEAFALGDYELPVGATVIVSPLVTHRCPKLYPDPRRFNPNRWLERRPGPYEYLPYGAGPRMCIGASLGAQILRLLVTMVLQRFRVAMVEGSRVAYKTGGVMMGPKPGVDLRLVPRDELVPRVAVRGNIHELVELDRLA